MSTQVQYRRGTGAQNDAFVGALGEITVDTTNWVLRVADGATTGGFSLVGANSTQTLVNKTYNGVSLSVSGNVTSAGNVAGGNLIVTGIIVDNTGNLELQTTVANGNINLTANGTGNITVNANIMPTANGTANIGSTTFGFNTIFARATTSQYADLAEMYSADKNYEPGTVVVFGGKKEITISTQSHSTQVAGIISTNPSYLMNSSLDCANASQVALVGRVPCSVVGTIAKGDRLVSSDQPGVATTLDIDQYQPGCIVGKALEEYDSTEPGVIEVAVGRL